MRKYFTILMTTVISVLLIGCNKADNDLKSDSKKISTEVSMQETSENTSESLFTEDENNKITDSSVLHNENGVYFNSSYLSGVWGDFYELNDGIGIYADNCPPFNHDYYFQYKDKYEFTCYYTDIGYYDTKNEEYCKYNISEFYGLAKIGEIWKTKFDNLNENGNCFAYRGSWFGIDSMNTLGLELFFTDKSYCNELVKLNIIEDKYICEKLEYAQIDGKYFENNVDINSLDSFIISYSPCELISGKYEIEKPNLKYNIFFNKDMSVKIVKENSNEIITVNGTYKKSENLIIMNLLSKKDDKIIIPVFLYIEQNGNIYLVEYLKLDDSYNEYNNAYDNAVESYKRACDVRNGIYVFNN